MHFEKANIYELSLKKVGVNVATYVVSENIIVYFYVSKSFKQHHFIKITD